MKFPRFSQLWDALVKDRPKSSKQESCSCCSMTEETKSALIEYGEGNKNKFEETRKILKDK